MIYRGLSIGVCLAPVFIFIGCMEPSTRYTRDAEGNLHMMVPADWDYRTNYHMPESRLKKIADSYLGTTYKNGGINRKGLDCSGFVCLVFKELNKATQEGKEKIEVSVCRDKNHLTIRTTNTETGYYVLYDWVFPDNGRIIAGAWHDPGGWGSSVGQMLQ